MADVSDLQVNNDNSKGNEVADVSDLQVNEDNLKGNDEVAAVSDLQDARPSTRLAQSSGTQQRMHERGKAIPFVAPEELQKDTLKQRTVILFIIVVGAASFTCL